LDKGCPSEFFVFVYKRLRGSWVRWGIAIFRGFYFACAAKFGKVANTDRWSSPFPTISRARVETQFPVGSNILPVQKANGSQLRANRKQRWKIHICVRVIM
jgi:hypothetical protein